MNKFFAIALAAAAGNVFAQNVATTEMTGQPLVYVREGVTRGCGVRLVGGRPLQDNKFQMFDASFNVWSDAPSMVKLSMYETTMERLNQGKQPTRYKLTGGWIKAKGSEAAAAPPAKHVTGDDGYSILFTSAQSPVFALFFAQVRGEPIQIGIRRAGNDFEQIFAGPIQMTPDEQTQVANCLAELAKSAPDDQAKPR